MRIIDISKELFAAPVYPGNEPAMLKQLMSMKTGDIYNATELTANVHTSTHADAFMHFVDGEIDIAQMPLEHYIGTCYVLEVEAGVVCAETIRRRVPSGTKRLLIKGKGGAVLSAEVAKYIAGCGIITVGTDYWSVAPLDNEAEIHITLFKQRVAVIESLDLSEAESGAYMLFAPPIKIKGAEGAPVRALLIEGMEIF